MDLLTLLFSLLGFKPLLLIVYAVIAVLLYSLLKGTRGLTRWLTIVICVLWPVALLVLLFLNFQQWRQSRKNAAPTQL